MKQCPDCFIELEEDSHTVLCPECLEMRKNHPRTKHSRGSELGFINKIRLKQNVRRQAIKTLGIDLVETLDSLSSEYSNEKE